MEQNLNFRIKNKEKNSFSILISHLFPKKRKPKTYQTDLIDFNQELGLFFNISIDLLCVADTKGYFVKVNKQWTKTLGYKEDELIGRPYFNFVHPEDLEKTLERFNTAENEINLISENRYRHKDGSYRWLEWRSVPHGKYIFATARDVTERKLSDEKCRLLFQNLSNGFALHQLIYDENNKPVDFLFLEANPAYCSYFNIKHQDLVGKNARSVFPKVLPEWIESAEEVIKNKRTLNYKLYIDFLNKHFDILTYRTDDDKFATVYKDITEWVVTEDLLRQSEQRFRGIVENLPVAIGITTLNGEITYHNQIFYQYFGFKKEDITNIQSWSELAYPDPEYRAYAMKMWKQDIADLSSGLSKKAPVRIYDITNIEGIKKYFEISFSIIEDYIYVIFNDISDRINAINRLKTSEKKFSDIFNLSPSMMGISRLKDGVLIEANPAFSISTGYTPKEYIEQTSLDLGLWNDSHHREKIISMLKMNGEIHNMEIELKTKHGDIIPCLYSSKPIAYNEVDCQLFIINDISELKKTESDLLQEKVITNAVIDSVPGLVYLYDSNGKLVRWNKMHETATGYSAEELSNMNLLDWYKDSPKDIEVVTKGVSKALSEGFADAEAWLTLKDGSKQLYYFTAVPITINGESYFTGMGIEITKRKMAEKELAEERNLLRTLLDTISIIVYVKDRDSRFVLVNHSLNNLVGGDIHSIIGKTDFDFFPKDKASEFYEDEQLLIKTGNPMVSKEEIMKDKSGKDVVLLTTKMPLLDVDGNITGLVGAGLDITDRIKAEKEVRKLNETLELKIKERTTQLEEAFKELEAFAYSVSHDLRAPLRHIDGFLKLMFAGFTNPSKVTETYFEKINASTKRMSLLIDDLLTFSRLGRKALNIVPVNLNSIINDILEQYTPEAMKRNIQWNIEKLPIVKGDNGLLRIVFENLISNAIKYTSNKPLAIIHIGSKRLNNSRVEFFIKDNGAGFDMVFVDKLFGVFQRLHTTDEFEGTGIGLANIKQIIKRHYGTVRAEGKVGEGAAFFITLEPWENY